MQRRTHHFDGGRLRVLRHKAGFTIGDLAYHLGFWPSSWGTVGERTIKHWESGGKEPGDERRDAIEAFFSLPRGTLWAPQKLVDDRIARNRRWRIDRRGMTLPEFWEYEGDKP